MTTRREVLAAALAATALVPPAAGAAPLASIRGTDNQQWDEAFARYKTAKVEFLRFHDEVYDPAMDPIAGLEPPYRIRHTAKNGHVATFAINGPDLASYDIAPGGMWFAIRDQVLEAQAKYAAYCAHHETVDVQSLNRRSDTLGDAKYEAEKALFITPVPHLSALAWKLEHLRECCFDSVIEPSDIAQLLLDVRRLAERGVE